MFRVIFLQVGATIIAAVGAGGFAGARGVISALLGGVVCALPNFLFALRLRFVAKRPGASYPVNFLLGELLGGYSQTCTIRQQKFHGFHVAAINGMHGGIR